jgi:hypothetical protein
MPPNDLFLSVFDIKTNRFLLGFIFQEILNRRANAGINGKMEGYRLLSFEFNYI